MPFTPGFDATPLPVVPVKKPGHIGLGSWQVWRAEVKAAREYQGNLITV
ncbi:hypothetical protein MAA8898_00654 [Maliponia aquimaris]|uniref:Uncharacterized protein n=2 Tax=Maliponia aquimaris TaxID=1673631 RepID=A0A238JYS1_9RHOB|nr:hypothetical protein MAA8898_00654 [Maliponia aquimaris]